MTNPVATTAHEAAKLIGTEIDDALILQTAKLAFLTAVADRQIDMAALAREELANRGIDRSGKWIGFPAARKVWIDSA